MTRSSKILREVNTSGMNARAYAKALDTDGVKYRLVKQDSRSSIIIDTGARIVFTDNDGVASVLNREGQIIKTGLAGREMTALIKSALSVK